MRARLRFNLIGLVGSGSPLPAFYAEQALGDSEDGNPTRNFLDLFHHRLQRLMLPIWKKYRYRASFESGALDPFSSRLFALIGLGGEEIRQARGAELEAPAAVSGLAQFACALGCADRSGAALLLQARQTWPLNSALSAVWTFSTNSAIAWDAQQRAG